jgi:hypothetical protein
MVLNYGHQSNILGKRSLPLQGQLLFRQFNQSHLIDARTSWKWLIWKNFAIFEVSTLGFSLAFHDDH